MDDCSIDYSPIGRTLTLRKANGSWLAVQLRRTGAVFPIESFEMKNRRGEGVSIVNIFVGNEGPRWDIAKAIDIPNVDLRRATKEDVAELFQIPAANVWKNPHRLDDGQRYLARMPIRSRFRFAEFERSLANVSAEQSNAMHQVLDLFRRNIVSQASRQLVSHGRYCQVADYDRRRLAALLVTRPILRHLLDEAVSILRDNEQSVQRRRDACHVLAATAHPEFLSHADDILALENSGHLDLEQALLRVAWKSYTQRDVEEITDAATIGCGSEKHCLLTEALAAANRGPTECDQLKILFAEDKLPPYLKVRYCAAAAATTPGRRFLNDLLRVKRPETMILDSLVGHVSSGNATDQEILSKARRIALDAELPPKIRSKASFVGIEGDGRRFRDLYVTCALNSREPLLIVSLVGHLHSPLHADQFVEELSDLLNSNEVPVRRAAAIVLSACSSVPNDQSARDKLITAICRIISDECPSIPPLATPIILRFVDASADLTPCVQPLMELARRSTKPESFANVLWLISLVTKAEIRMLCPTTVRGLPRRDAATNAWLEKNRSQLLLELEDDVRRFDAASATSQS